MKRLYRALVSLAAFLTVIPALAAEKPTFVLVHGALFTSTGWAKTQNALQNEGYNVVTLDVPGRLGDGADLSTLTLQKVAQKVCQVVKLQSGLVILVGHSQGGALITQALNDCGDKVKALIYVAAVLPLNGETAFQGLNQQKDTGFGECAESKEKEGIFKLKKDGPLARLFFDDAPEEDKAALVANMVSEPLLIGTTEAKVDAVAFKNVPKFYIETTEDKIVTRGTQQALIKKASPWNKVYTLKSSHCPFLGKPALLKEFVGDLVNAAQSLN